MKLLGFGRVVKGQWTRLHRIIRFLVPKIGIINWCLSCYPGRLRTHTVAPFEFLSFARSHHSLIHSSKRGFAHSADMSTPLSTSKSVSNVRNRSLDIDVSSKVALSALTSDAILRESPMQGLVPNNARAESALPLSVRRSHKPRPMFSPGNKMMHAGKGRLLTHDIDAGKSSSCITITKLLVEPPANDHPPYFTRPSSNLVQFRIPEQPPCWHFVHIPHASHELYRV